MSLRLSPFNASRAITATGAGLRRMLVLLQPECKRETDFRYFEQEFA
jgi:hypothetical protein